MEKVRGIEVIAFDADDTLWENETFFRDAELQFVELMSEYATKQEVLKALYDVEIANMAVYGYGIKAFMLSLIETANLLSGFQTTARQTNDIIEIGKEMLDKPVQLLEGVEEVLRDLSNQFKLIVATKGDLLDQERKLKKSGLLKYFHHIEIMSDKTVDAYKSLVRHLDVKPSEILMVGNSLKSDILPVLEIGGWGVHIPFHTTWQHEIVTEKIFSERFFERKGIKELLALFS
ncbi:HAD family hydrolase [Carboxylicivirga sp. A043]|uniref:HAD family hydrolase n=1 Tax=Carboxylicivirga litoralis TaxID=2816963 RepID=UPI0021CB6D93|nr:HAD family hydrolase [Carboxylicivirga sp. A043]MCU4156736.1 HAD family hydrolase [Carboxylicivirga sp. A043]